MYTINYDFEPGDTVYVVIDDNRVEAGVVLTSNFKVYLNLSDVLTTDITYNVLLNDANEGTVSSDSSNVFATLSEATDKIEASLTP